MSEESLKQRIGELITELESKDREIIQYLTNIEQLEEKLYQMETKIPIDGSKSSRKKGIKAVEDKIAKELEEKDKEIRDLKDKLGFLRKEKIQVQKELESYTKNKSKGVVIRIEEKHQPLEILVKELQSKINKQQVLIQQLQKESNKEEVFALRSKITELQGLLTQNQSITHLKSEESIPKRIRLMENKLKTITDAKKAQKLNNKLLKIREKLNRPKIGKSESYINEIRKTNENLRKEINQKNIKIKKMKKTIENLKKSLQGEIPPKEIDASEDQFKTICEDLQIKLNAAKNQINSLKQELNEYKIMKAPIEHDSRDEIINELRNKLEKLNAQQQILSKITSSDVIQAASSEDLSLALRVRELKNIIDDLNKQNIQQRLEISTLRKKIP